MIQIIVFASIALITAVLTVVTLVIAKRNPESTRVNGTETLILSAISGFFAALTIVAAIIQ